MPPFSSRAARGPRLRPSHRAPRRRCSPSACARCPPRHDVRGRHFRAGPRDARGPGALLVEPRARWPGPLHRLVRPRLAAPDRSEACAGACHHHGREGQVRHRAAPRWPSPGDLPGPADLLLRARGASPGALQQRQRVVRGAGTRPHLRASETRIKPGPHRGAERAPGAPAPQARRSAMPAQRRARAAAEPRQEACAEPPTLSCAVSTSRYTPVAVKPLAGYAIPRVHQAGDDRSAPDRDGDAQEVQSLARGERCAAAAASHAEGRGWRRGHHGEGGDRA